ncbi:brown isoform X2 [Nomia melanderi]|uniref:brown isoform X2 n=2 Tax=Nomia melanderi TaxID=2448451 RepID=UPI0013046496|nr:protein scarlet-like isoform X1 [Nomia melanderi]XP_031842655.1 protein scarlet-like isoform X1 [Nomia melanderi]XP_031842656.1 protein scarlet-like isoform X1 [Nomia melanderi]
MIFFHTRTMTQRAEYPPLPQTLPKDFCLTWKNISYTVRKTSNGGIRAIFGLQPTEYVSLLQGVNGIVHSGMLMAILGPSGAGKTTLLATISRRVKGSATGEILLNGKPIDTGQMIRISGFVPQMDLAIESLTVLEHMEFMACMKMDRRIRFNVRKQRITAVLAELGLVKCVDSRLSALSTGERRRVALAVQLLTEPNILFCDEPTTGLDSYGALTVVRTLREVAARGKIVVCSVHQPASGLLDIFHEVLLLSGGRVAFQGSSVDATQFFDSLNLRCPPTFNSAEFYVSQLSIVRGKEAESYRKVNWICDQYEGSKYGQRVAKLIEYSCSSRSDSNRLPPIFSEVPAGPVDFKRARALTQLEWLVWRTYVDYKRSSASIFLRFLTYLFIGLLISSPYVGITGKPMDQGGIQNMQGLLYLVVVETVFTFNYAVFYTFPRELPLLLRDIAAGLYHPAPYYISKVVVLIPGAIVQPLLYSILVFTIVGLNGGFVGLVYFALPVVVCAISASAFGLFLSASFKSIDTASLFSVPLDFLGLMFCGIYLHLGHLAPGIGWLKYVSQFYYGLEAVSLTQWLLIDHINCSSDPEEPCISTGLGVLEKYGYLAHHYTTDLIGLLAIFMFSHFAGFLIIRHRSRKEAVY